MVSSPARIVSSLGPRDTIERKTNEFSRFYLMERILGQRFRARQSPEQAMLRSDH
jgi:hypothetical protein